MTRPKLIRLRATRYRNSQPPLLTHDTMNVISETGTSYAARARNEPPLRKQARTAGLYYLVLALLAPIADMYLPRQFFVARDPAATARNIAESMMMFRVWIVSEVALNVVMLLVALSLYTLLRDVDRRHARLMVSLVLVGVTIAIVTLLLPSVALILVSQAEIGNAFGEPQRDALVYALWRSRSFGVQIAFIFWGLWLFPFGLLVRRSGFLPRWLGTLLIVGGAAYVVLSVVGLTLPQFFRMLVPVLMPFFLAGELSAIVYLLVKGVRTDAEPRGM